MNDIEHKRLCELADGVGETSLREALLKVIDAMYTKKGTLEESQDAIFIDEVSCPTK